LPFNGAGVFTRLYSWVSDKASSIKINSTRMDAEMDGFAAGLSNCITKDGQTTLTANIPFNGRKITSLGDATADTDALNRQTADARYVNLAGDSMTGSLNFAKGSDIVSAATTDIGAATGNYVTVTGTTTITALGTAQAGTRREVRFSGALTLTHNATSLILPTGANIVTAADDVATFVSEGSGNWRCIAYQRFSTSPLTLSVSNLIINGEFRFNQRGYASGAALAAGGYGFDRWKGGASGVTLTFTAGTSGTTVTIASGTLVQTIEASSVVGGTYTLSWTGTAQARVGISGASPSGSYASSPVTVTGATAGQAITVEFNTGTLGKVQLEEGSSSTGFHLRSYADELALCQRYYEKSYEISTAPGTATDTGAHFFRAPTTNTNQYPEAGFKQTKRSTPTVTIYNPVTGGAGAGYNLSVSASRALTAAALSSRSIAQVNFGVAPAAGDAIYFHWTAEAEL
jgi:hypothetical protein